MKDRGKKRVEYKGDAISRSGDLEQFKKDIFTTQVQTEKWFLRALITRLLLQEITQKINLEKV